MQQDDMKDRLLDASMAHVPFDGWSDRSLCAAAADCGMDPALARALYPRGGVDLALAYHARGDAAMTAMLKQMDLSTFRFRDRITLAVRTRLDLADRELVRRGTTLFSLPQHMADGAAALWRTSDAIWSALGDTSRDLNWYTKRATLSAVHGSTVLYWLGDESPDHQDTWDFLGRRVDEVMQFEKLKASVRENPVGKVLMVPLRLLDRVRAPALPTDLPGFHNK